MTLAHIDRLRAEFPRLVETCGNCVNDEHLCRAAQERADRRQEPDSAGTIDDHDVTGDDSGKFRRVKCGRKRVCKQHEVVFPPVAGFAG